MTLKIVLSYHIDSINIAKLIEHGIIRIMACSYSIDIVLFIVTISFITSSRFGTRPVIELNSWRFTPLNTIRLPFSFMSPSTISNLLKPASWLINSVSFLCVSLTIILTSYRFGFSALHNRGFSHYMSPRKFPYS